MSRRRSVLAVILMLAMMTVLTPTLAETTNVIEVTHSPDVPESGEDVNITIEVENAINISSIKIIYCTIEPFRCELPANMTKSSFANNLYEYTIEKEFDPGTKMGFKFKIEFNDTTTQDFPTSTADSNIHLVEGPFQGYYYFTYTLESEPGIDTDLLTWILIIVIIIAIMPLIAAILLWMKKRKGRKDEDEK